jgi:hypothetical protein
MRRPRAPRGCQAIAPKKKKEREKEEEEEEESRTPILYRAHLAYSLAQH